MLLLFITIMTFDYQLAEFYLFSLQKCMYLSYSWTYTNYVCYFYLPDLRLQLLDSDKNQDLIKSLYGLLMLLPQAEPFTLLRNRLNCIPHFQMAAIGNK
jgi:hypothetical protein